MLFGPIVDHDSILHTDGAAVLQGIMPLGQHEAVDHDKLLARRLTATRLRSIATRLRRYFSILKRGIVGTFQHVSPAHLPRYLNEFDFRMNTRKKLGFDDATRAAISSRVPLASG